MLRTIRPVRSLRRDLGALSRPFACTVASDRLCRHVPDHGGDRGRNLGHAVFRRRSGQGERIRVYAVAAPQRYRGLQPADQGFRRSRKSLRRIPAPQSGNQRGGIDIRRFGPGCDRNRKGRKEVDFRPSDVRIHGGPEPFGSTWPQLDRRGADRRRLQAGRTKRAQFCGAVHRVGIPGRPVLAGGQLDAAPAVRKFVTERFVIKRFVAGDAQRGNGADRRQADFLPRRLSRSLDILVPAEIHAGCRGGDPACRWVTLRHLSPPTTCASH